MKTLNKKKNKFKVLKQQLIERINSARTLKELEGWERTMSYHDCLKENYEWDYDFLLSIIEFKLKRMSDYFHNTNIVVDEDKYGDICDKAIAILHAGYKTDVILSSDLTNYVNSKNMDRFLSKIESNFIKKKAIWDKYGLATVREAKAKALFWKYLYYYIERLWD